MRRALVIALLIIAAVPFVIVAATLPVHGDPEAPVQTGVSARYVANGAEETGADNLVTGVILNYRGLDTAGEVTVIFTALAAVFAALLPVTIRSDEPSVAEVEVSPVVLFVVRLLAPFIAVFAVSVVASGHSAPGGGFQGGALLGGLFIALSLVLGTRRTRAFIPEPTAVWLRAAAPVTFVVVGAIGLALTGSFLGYPVAPEHHAITSAMITALEFGIGLGGATIFAAVFLEMEAQ